MTTQPDSWFADYQNIIELANYMAEIGKSASEVAYMVEKPWKHAELWNQCVAAHEA